MTTQILNPAFRIDWQVNTSDVTEKILQMLENMSVPIRSSSKGGKRRRRNGGGKDDKKDSAVSIGEKDDGSQSAEPQNQENPTKSAEEDPKSKEFKDRVVLGISKIVRLLEKRCLSIVLFDRSFLHPSAIAQFIGSACISSGAHCTCLDGLNTRLASVLNVRSANVIGIAKSIDGSSLEAVDSVVNAVISLTKPVVMAAQIDEDGDRKKKKKRKGPRMDASADLNIESNYTPYVEATVLVQQRTKKKKK